MASTKGTSERERSAQKAFGERLKQARERVGLDVPTAARKMRVGRSTFYSWESGDRKPRNLVRLADLVDATIAELFGGAS